MVLEVASSESDEHVFSIAHKYLGPRTAIQIVFVLLFRPKLIGANRLECFAVALGYRIYIISTLASTLDL